MESLEGSKLTDSFREQILARLKVLTESDSYGSIPYYQQQMECVQAEVKKLKMNLLQLDELQKAHTFMSLSQQMFNSPAKNQATFQAPSLESLEFRTE